METKRNKAKLLKNQTTKKLNLEELKKANEDLERQNENQMDKILGTLWALMVTLILFIVSNASDVMSALVLKFSPIGSTLIFVLIFLVNWRPAVWIAKKYSQR